MQAVIIREHGDLDQLKIETLPDPEPAPDQVLVRVKACGINHLDLWVRRGIPGVPFPLPLTPGSDISGVVEGIGSTVTNAAVGDEVVLQPGISCGTCRACLSGRDHHCKRYGILGEHINGGYAELIAVPAASIVPKPKNLSFEQAGAIGVAWITAWHMLVARAEIRPGETALIQAAGSGVSSAAIQIAKLWGARVIATAGTDAKLERARALGADHVFNYSDADVAKEVKALTQKRGADVVIDHVGVATWESSMKSLRWRGRFVTCGATTGFDVPLNLRHLFFKAQSLMGSTMGSKGEYCEVVEHMAAGTLKPVVDRTLPLSEVKAAHALIEKREVFGKLVLVP